MSGKLSIDKENAIKILEYWFVMEFLNQQSLSNLKKKEQEALKYKTDLKTGNVKRKKVVEDFVRFKCGDNLRTIAKADSKVMQLPIWSNFTVFLGCMKKEICIRKISQHVEWNGQSPDKNYDEIALATLNFSKDGSYISNSLSISPIAWAMKKLSGGTENASQKLSIDNYNSDTRATETKIADLFNSLGNGAVVSEAAESCQILNIVSYDLLLKVENMICSELNIEDKDMRSYLAVYFKLYASENDIEDDDGGVGLHMDFYSKDLEIASDGLRNNRFSKEKEKLLLDYILGINRYNNDLKKPLNRFDIIKPKTEEELFQFMTENLTAAKAPLGKWPSRFMPVLMQQIAVNIATDPDMKLPVFSVNGPPGTGKTTLLKEIIVSNIVEKAILLAEYDNPDDAFDDFPFLYRDDQGNSYNQCYGKYHRLKNKKINRYSILVASSNNTAVENITKELPVEENLLENIKPSKKVCGPNEEALAELTELFTVSKSTEILPFIRKVWKKRANENGEKEKICERVVEEQPDIYFSRLATELLNADVEDKDQKKLQALGLISASLGKKENIEKVEKNVIAPFLDIIGTNEDIEPRKESYLEVRKQFLLQLKLVKDLRKELDKLREKEKAVAEAHEMAGKIEKHAEAQKKKQNFQLSEIDNAIRDHQNIISRLSAEKEALETRIAVIRATYSELEKNINTQQNNIATAQKRIDELNNSISKWEKFIKTKKYKKMLESVAHELETLEQYQQQSSVFDHKLSEKKQQEVPIQEEINNLLSKVNEENRNLDRLFFRRKTIETERQRLEGELVVAKKKEEDQRSLLEKERENYQNKNSYERGFVLDRQFISDILSDDQKISTEAQIRNPWFSEHYNREREKLFLYALRMTKGFILNSKKCRNNFQHLYCLWSGNYYGNKKSVKFIGDDLQNCTAASYESLFLLIPVISSTFASVQRLLGNVKEEDFVGTLVVDEAGQASPHMAIGALCRSRKAVIVGDPKQVEPVVTDDQDLLKQTYTDDLFKPYKDKTNSVQRFADIMNPYGTYLKNAQGKDEWVGCPLLVHRRCISPMYEISNDISYNNIMKQQAAQPKPEKEKLFIAEKSQWFNVNGKEEGLKQHFVKEQGEKVIKMLEIAFSKNANPDVFIISPFETVESGVKEYVKKYAKKCKKDGIQSSLVDHEDSLYAWLNRNVGTVHKFQGREAAEVIFLLGCDTSKDARPAIQWVNNNIVNVAATRAKYRFYVIGDIDAWGESKCVKRAKKILDSSAAGSLGWVPQNRDLNGGYTLIIAEKRYAADVYATALCTWNEGHIIFNPENDHPETTDFYEGNGYLISWCLGHLFELFYPEDYNTKYKKWDVHDLPIIPNEWKYKIKDDYKEKEDSKHRFDVLKNLMSRDDVTDILCATDAGREGELIFREVYQQSGCKRPFQRTWLSSMETTSIRKVFENPDPSFRYYSFYKSARCRQLADWIVGMNATRYFTKQYGDNKETLNVGRVVTPTMAMIVEREKEIKDFVPKTYYTVNLNIDGITFESRPFEDEDEAIQVEQNCRESISVSEYGKF